MFPHHSLDRGAGCRGGEFSRGWRGAGPEKIFSDPDSGEFKATEAAVDTRLVGRSVSSTQPNSFRVRGWVCAASPIFWVTAACLSTRSQRRQSPFSSAAVFGCSRLRVMSLQFLPADSGSVSVSTVPRQAAVIRIVPAVDINCLAIWKTSAWRDQKY